MYTLAPNIRVFNFPVDISYIGVDSLNDGKLSHPYEIRLPALCQGVLVLLILPVGTADLRRGGCSNYHQLKIRMWQWWAMYQ